MQIPSLERVWLGQFQGVIATGEKQLPVASYQSASYHKLQVTRFGGRICQVLKLEPETGNW